MLAATPNSSKKGRESHSVSLYLKAKTANDGVLTDLSQVGPEAPVCRLCSRYFATVEQLQQHVVSSIHHREAVKIASHTKRSKKSTKDTSKSTSSIRKVAASPHHREIDSTWDRSHREPSPMMLDPNDTLDEPSAVSQSRRSPSPFRAGCTVCSPPGYTSPRPKSPKMARDLTTIELLQKKNRRLEKQLQEITSKFEKEVVRRANAEAKVKDLEETLAESRSKTQEKREDKGKYKRVLLERCLFFRYKTNVGRCFGAWASDYRKTKRMRGHLTWSFCAWRNLLVGKAFRTWGSFAHIDKFNVFSRSAHSELAAERAEKKWMAAAFTLNGRVFRTWRLSVADRIRRRNAVTWMLSSWQNRAVARGIRTWAERVNTRIVHKQKLNKFLRRWLMKTCATVIRTLQSRMQEKREKEAKLNRATRRIMLSREWNIMVKWRQYTRRLRVVKQKQAKLVMRMKNRALADVFDTFKHNCSEKRRRYLIISRVSKRMMNRKKSAAFNGWLSSAHERRRRNNILKKQLGLLTRGGVYRTFSAWVTFRDMQLDDHAAERRQCETRLIGDLQENLHRENQRAKEVLAAKAIRSMANRSLATSFQAWLFFLTHIQTTRRQLAHAAARWKNATSARCFQAWVSQTSRLSWQKRATKRVVFMLANRRLADGFLLLKSRTSDRARNRRLLAKAASRLTGLRSARAFTAWTDMASSRKKDRHRVKLSVGRIMNGTKGRVFSSWTYFTTEQRRLKTRAKMIVSRMTMSTQSRALEALKFFRQRKVWQRRQHAAIVRKWKNRFLIKPFLTWKDRLTDIRNHRLEKKNKNLSTDLVYLRQQLDNLSKENGSIHKRLMTCLSTHPQMEEELKKLKSKSKDNSESYKEMLELERKKREELELSRTKLQTASRQMGKELERTRERLREADNARTKTEMSRRDLQMEVDQLRTSLDSASEKQLELVDSMGELIKKRVQDATMTRRNLQDVEKQFSDFKRSTGRMNATRSTFGTPSRHEKESSVMSDSLFGPTGEDEPRSCMLDLKDYLGNTK